MDYETETGLIYDGYVQSGNVIFEGTLIQKQATRNTLPTMPTTPAARPVPRPGAFLENAFVLSLGAMPILKIHFCVLAASLFFGFPTWLFL